MNMWSTEELFFPIHDFEGTLWENREGYEKWDPAKFTAEWQTPELVSPGHQPPSHRACLTIISTYYRSYIAI